MNNCDPFNYPKIPGFKEKGGTSQAAARLVGRRSAALRERVLGSFPSPPAGLTADEVAKLLGEPITSVRPRLTELKETGRLEKTTERRKNEIGTSSAVYRRKD